MQFNSTIISRQLTSIYNSGYAPIKYARGEVKFYIASKASFAILTLISISSCFCPTCQNQILVWHMKMHHGEPQQMKQIRRWKEKWTERHNLQIPITTTKWTGNLHILYCVLWVPLVSLYKVLTDSVKTYPFR